MKYVSNSLLLAIAKAPMDNVLRDALLSQTEVETIDELFWSEQVVFWLHDKARFLVTLKHFHKEPRFSIVYQTLVRGQWYNQGEDLLEVATPMDIFQVLRERMVVNAHPGDRLNWNNTIPSYDRQTQVHDKQNKLVDNFCLIAMVEDKKNLFTYARLELMHELMVDHHLYGGIVKDEKVVQARITCMAHEVGVPLPSGLDEDTSIENYRLAVIEFMLNKGVTYKESGGKLSVSRGIGKYLLGPIFKSYLAEVDSFTMSYYSWETTDDAGNYGWYSNNSENFSPRNLEYVARAFAIRRHEAWKATNLGQTLEDIHHVEIQHRAPTAWELDKE